MDKFEELLQSIRDEQAVVIGEYQTKKTELENKLVKIDAKSKDLDARELTLETKEKDYTKKESDINEKFLKISSDEQMIAKWNEINTLIGVNEEFTKKGVNEHAEAVLKLEEVAKRELAVQERERTYEEKIRKQFADKLLK